MSKWKWIEAPSGEACRFSSICSRASRPRPGTFLTRAAESSISRQSALSRRDPERWRNRLGVPLFGAPPSPALLLTDAGQVLQATARAILDDVGQAVAQDPARPDGAAGHALDGDPLPRCAGSAAPAGGSGCSASEIEIFISGRQPVLDLDRERIDLAVRYCPSRWRRRAAHRLFGERLQPPVWPGPRRGSLAPARRAAGPRRGMRCCTWTTSAAAFRGSPGRSGSPRSEEPEPAGRRRRALQPEFDLMIQAALDGRGAWRSAAARLSRPSLEQERKLVGAVSRQALFELARLLHRSFGVGREALRRRKPSSHGSAAEARESNVDDKPPFRSHSARRKR